MTETRSSNSEIWYPTSILTTADPSKSTLLSVSFWSTKWNYNLRIWDFKININSVTWCELCPNLVRYVYGNNLLDSDWIIRFRHLELFTYYKKQNKEFSTVGLVNNRLLDFKVDSKVDSIFSRQKQRKHPTLPSSSASWCIYGKSSNSTGTYLKHISERC